MNSYDYGVTLRISCSVKNDAGVAVDPTTLTIKMKNPTGTVVTLVYGTDVEVIRTGVGAYYLDVYCNSGGVWSWQWISTAPDGSKQDQFKVESSFI